MKKHPFSLFLRLLVFTLPVEGLLLAGFGFAVVHHVEKRTFNAFKESLVVRARSLADLVDIEGNGSVGADLDSEKFPKGLFIRLSVPSHHFDLEEPAGWNTSWPVGIGVTPKGRKFKVVSHGGQRYLLLTGLYKHIEDANEDKVGHKASRLTVHVALAASLADVMDANEDMRQAVWVAAITLLMLTGLLQWFVIHFGLAPVRRLSAHVARMPGRTAGQRLDETGAPKEIKPFVKEINALLERIETLLEGESRFAADAAHELRTPITLVKSTLQSALLAGKGESDAKQALNESLEDLGRLESTAESLLELSRWSALKESGKFEKEPVNLDELLREIAAEWTPAANERGITLSVHLAPGGSVRGLRFALKHLLSNIVSNAVRYTGEGDSVVITNAVLDGGGVVVTIEDSGEAIPAEERDKLFTRFYRGPMSRRFPHAGSGLGLSIALAIAQAHGAELSYSSPTKRGNVFSILFPRG